MKSRAFLTFRMWVSYGIAICFIAAAMNASRKMSSGHAVSDMFGDALTAFVGIAFLIDANRVRRHFKERGSV